MGCVPIVGLMLMCEPGCSADRRIDGLYRELRRERQLRREAERNALRFHALMLQARIRALPKRKT